MLWVPSLTQDDLVSNKTILTSNLINGVCLLVRGNGMGGHGYKDYKTGLLKKVKSYGVNTYYGNKQTNNKPWNIPRKIYLYPDLFQF